eukprot:gene14195-14338_t
MAGAQDLAVEDHTSTSSHILTQLPVDILCRCVVQPYLSSLDKSSLRQSTRWGRQLVNAAACRCTLDASLPDHAAAAAKLPVNFPGLQHVGIVNKAATASATAAEGTSSGSFSAAVQLQEQLPLLLQQVRSFIGLATLATLHMAAISPAKGWGSALQMLRGCALRELVLVFADVCDGDMAGLAALTGLTHLDLHCSRQLMELHAEFDLRALPEPPAALFADRFVKPEAQLTVVTAVRAVQQIAAASDHLDQWGHAAQQALHLQDRHTGNLSNLGGGSSSSINHQHPFMIDSAEFAREIVEEASWPPLQHVQVCSGCSIGNLNKLLHHCKGLRHLQLDSLGPNGNGVAAALVNRAPQLTALQLSGCSSMSEHACSSIGSQLHVLQELHLHETAIPATHLMALLRGIAGSCCHVEVVPLQHLKHLRIERCAGFTDEVVGGVVMHLSELQTLEVVGCQAVSGKALLSLVGRLVKLTRLLVAGCRAVGADFEWAWQRAAAEMFGAGGSLGPDAGDGGSGPKNRWYSRKVYYNGKVICTPYRATSLEAAKDVDK